MLKTKKPQPHVNKSGYLGVGNGHEIYWQDWGNPKAFPIISLHGGPGDGFKESHKLYSERA